MRETNRGCGSGTPGYRPVWHDDTRPRPISPVAAYDIYAVAVTIAAVFTRSLRGQLELAGSSVRIWELKSLRDQTAEQIEYKQVQRLSNLLAA